MLGKADAEVDTYGGAIRRHSLEHASVACDTPPLLDFHSEGKCR
jgi:hypothetical protein